MANYRGNQTMVPPVTGTEQSFDGKVYQYPRDLDKTRGTSLSPTGIPMAIPKTMPHVTGDIVRDTLMASDSAYTNAPRLGQEPGANAALDQRLQTSVQGFASRMGLSRTPQIIVGDVNSSMADTPTFFSSYTREGTPTIIINQKALRSLSPEQLEGVLALETARLSHGDSKPDNFAEGINNPNAAHQRTFYADRMAAGPQGTNNPRALAEALTIGERYRVDALKKVGAVDLRDPEHPPIEQRIGRLMQQEQMQARPRANAGPR